MTKARLDGLYFLILGSLVFVLLGFALENASPTTMGDFRTNYYPARCLLQHGGPYRQGDVLRAYKADGRGRPEEPVGSVLTATEYIYLPTAFTITVPIALLPYGPAHLLWMAASFGSLIVAGFLMWSSAADSAPVLSGILIGFLLANSELIVTNGNPAGIVIGLCIIAAWCVINEKLGAVGVICLAVSLMLKPHDAWLVWLYFLLAGGSYRKRAIQVLVVILVLSLPFILWVTYIEPHWIHDLLSNMSQVAAQGGTDPGPASARANKPSMIIDLQAVVSFFYDNPSVYNLVSYLCCGSLIFLWSAVTLRSRLSKERTWLALASVGALTMLPIYHRECDAKLLLLTIPACALLWFEGHRIGKLAAFITLAGLLVTADIPWAIDMGIVHHLNRNNTGLGGEIFTASQVLPAPIILLVVSVFYLSVYVQRCRTETIA